jgi:hypothetical protein
MIEFEKKVSLGHIIQVGIVLVALATGWLTSRDKLHDLEAEVGSQKITIAALQSRFDNFQSDTAGSVGRLQNLLTDLRVDIGNHGLGARK